jgi:hypothetical protein
MVPRVDSSNTAGALNRAEMLGIDVHRDLQSASERAG